MGQLRIEVLGALRVVVAGGEVALGGPKQRAVLAALALDHGRVVSRSRLIEAVWGDDPAESAARTLQVYVSNLRKVVGSEAIVARGSGYALELGVGSSLDLVELAAAVATARQNIVAGEAEAAIAAARRGLDLFHGTPLDEFADLEYFEPDLGRLSEAQLSLQLMRYEAETLLDSDPISLLPELEALVKDHPTNERVHAIYMTLLYRADRQADALAVYQGLRDRLLEELGLDPSVALQDLEQRILAHDPELLVAAGAVHASRTVSVSRLSPTTHLEVEGRRILLTREVTTLGRLPDRDVVLNQPEISRHHAEIRRVGDSFRIIDCGSTNGLTVNGVPVLDESLADGDVIFIGTYSIRFGVGD